MTSTPQPPPGGEQTAGAPTPPAGGQRSTPSSVPRPPATPPADQPVRPVAELAELATLAERPLTEHVAVLDGIHRALTEQLRGAES